MTRTAAASGSRTSTPAPRMFTDEAWQAGYDRAVHLGLTTLFAELSRPVTRPDVDAIVSAVANHGFEEAWAQTHVPDHVERERGDAWDRIRDHLLAQLAVDVLREGCVMVTLPREIVERPEPYLAVLKVIAPVRRLAP